MGHDRWSDDHKMSSQAKGVRALVVDDNPFVREIMVRGLEPLCEVSVATDGADALLQAVDDPPDLIVLDSASPSTHRFPLLRQLRFDLRIDQGFNLLPGNRLQSQDFPQQGMSGLRVFPRPGGRLDRQNLRLELLGHRADGGDCIGVCCCWRLWPARSRPSPALPK